MPDELRGLARREAEHGSRERLEDQILRAEGEHRDEDEDRELPRLRIVPDLRQRRAEGKLRGCAGGRGRGMPASTPATASSVSTKAEQAVTAVTATRRCGENGSRKWPASADVTMKPTIIITQTIVAAARDGVVDLLGEQDQQRGAGGADADADQQERDNASATPAVRLVPSRPCRWPRRCRRARARPCRRRSRACAAAHVGAVPSAAAASAPRVQGDQDARQHRRQRQFDHHHAVHRRRGEHDDRAERGLHQTETDDAEPAERTQCGTPWSSPDAKPRTAKARPACRARRASRRSRCTRARVRAGLGEQRAPSGEAARQQAARSLRHAGPPQANSSATPRPAARPSRRRRRAPRVGAELHGSERMPMRRSPSIDLKSFSVMMPCAPRL
jgi:hypothetical protein